MSYERIFVGCRSAMNVPEPTDADLDQLIAAAQQLPPGRIDIDRDEWLAVLELLRDTRAWVLAVRVGLERP